MKNYEKYADEIPKETKLIVATFDDPIRQAIIVLLQGKGKLSFSKIKSELAVGKLTLNYHLKKLYSAGLIDHFFEHEFGKREYSYYSITSLGERFLKNLVRALIPDNPLIGIETKETIGPVYGVTLEGFSWSTSDLADNKNEVVVYTKDFELLLKNIQVSVPNVLARIAARTDRTRYTVQKW